MIFTADRMAAARTGVRMASRPAHRSPWRNRFTGQPDQPGPPLPPTPTPTPTPHAAGAQLGDPDANTITVTANRSHHGDAGTQPASAGESNWTRHQTIWTVVGVLVAIVGTYFAYRQWKG
jgi:hypothetical protein